MAKKVCVVCREEIKSGKVYRVKDDKAIQFIRAIKTRLGIVQGNELCICAKDIKEQVEKRRKFEKELIIYSIVAAVIVVLFGAMPILAGNINFGAILGSLLVGVMIVLLFVVFRYVPAVDKEPRMIKPAKPVKKKKR